MGARRGSTLVTMCLSLLFILGTIGLVTDLGYAYFVQQKAQAAADAAALAGTTYAIENGVASSGTKAATLCSDASITSGTAVYVACEYAEQNGFPASAITISSGTGSTTGCVCAYWVQAMIAQPLPQMFSRLVGDHSNTTMNVAGLSVSGAVTGNSVIALGASGSSGTVTASNNGSVNVCGNVVAGTTPSNTVVSYVYNGYNCGGSSLTTSSNGASSSSNPYSSLTPPTPLTTCPTTSQTTTSFSSGSATIDPANGPFCSNLFISGTANVTFKPGIVWVNTLLSISGEPTITNQTSSGIGGVMFYVASGAIAVSSACVGATCTNISLTAPTSGTYAGVAFYQNSSSAASITNGSIGSGAIMNIKGAIYTPNSTLTYSGGTATGSISPRLVAKNIVFSTITSYLGPPYRSALVH